MDDKSVPQDVRHKFLSNLPQNAFLSNEITALHNSSSARLFEGCYCLLGVQCCGSLALISPSISVEVRIRGVSPMLVRTEFVAANVKVEAPILSSLSSPISSLLRRLFNEVILCPLYGRQRKQSFVQILSPLEASQSTYLMRATNAPRCMAGRQAATTTRENNPTATAMHNLRLLQRYNRNLCFWSVLCKPKQATADLRTFCTTLPICNTCDSLRGNRQPISLCIIMSIGDMGLET